MRPGLTRTLLGIAAALLVGCSDESDDGTGPDPEPVPELDSILTIAPADTALLEGQSVQLTATLLDPDSQPISTFSVSYSVVDPAVASLGPGGVVTGLSSGQTSVIATVGGAADTVGITVPMSFSNVAAGFSTCAVRTSGEGRCWGFNHQGELGAGSLGEGGQGPVTPAGELVFSVIRTSIGYDSTFTCGLTFVGEAYCWGNNNEGQLGAGDLVSSPSPRRVLGEQVFLDLDLGLAHACAMTSAQQVFCWGSNDYGQLGTGDSIGSSQPVPVPTDLRFVTVRAGGAHTCALDDSGVAYCWGTGEGGQLGTGSTDGSPVPIPVEGDHRFASLDAAGDDTCGVTTNGEAFCWGWNSNGEVGNGRFYFNEPILAPSVVVGGHTWTAISAGAGYTCGITVEGPTYCWGIDADGRLGIGQTGTAFPHPSPELVIGDHDFVVITTGYDQTCAISSAPGRPLFCWGRNNRGQLDGYAGDYTIAYSFTPRLVTGF